MRYIDVLRSLGTDTPASREAVLEQRGAERAPLCEYFYAYMRAPEMREEIDLVFWARQAQQESIPGRTAIVVDLSARCHKPARHQHGATPAEVAAFMALALRCEEKAIFLGADNLVHVPISESLTEIFKIQEHRETGRRLVAEWLTSILWNMEVDRIILLTGYPGHLPNLSTDTPLIEFNTASDQFKRETWNGWTKLRRMGPRSFEKIREVS